MQYSMRTRKIFQKIRTILDTNVEERSYLN